MLLEFGHFHYNRVWIVCHVFPSKIEFTYETMFLKDSSIFRNLCSAACSWNKVLISSKEAKGRASWDIILRQYILPGNICQVIFELIIIEKNVIMLKWGNESLWDGAFLRKSLSIANWRRWSDIWDDRFPEEELNSLVFIKMLSIKVLVFFANFVGSTMYGAKICMYQLFMP